MFYPNQGGTYNLGASIGSTDTTILLSSFLEPVSGTPLTMTYLNTSIAFGTIAPTTSSAELISFTGITQNANGTATLTGVIRGLQKSYPYTTSATFQLPHAGQSIFILSDAPQVFDKYAGKDNNEEITGLWTFDQTPIGLNPGAVQDASTTVKGITKLSVAPVSSTNPIAVGQNDPILPTQNQTNALVGNNTDIAVGSGNKVVTQTGLIHGAEKYATTTGSANAYVATLSPIPTSLTAGMTLSLIANFTNTGAATLAVNGLGSTPAITKNGTTALVSGDIVSGQAFTVTWDGTRWQLQSPTGTTPVNSYASAFTSVSSTTTQNIDTTFTTNFLPAVITVYFKISGYENFGGELHFTRGIAVYAGTTVKNVLNFYSDSNNTTLAITAATLTDAQSNPAVGNNSQTGNISATLSILSVSATNFVVRVAYSANATPPAVAAVCTFNAVANQ